MPHTPPPALCRRWVAKYLGSFGQISGLSLVASFVAAHLPFWCNSAAPPAFPRAQKLCRRNQTRLNWNRTDHQTPAKWLRFHDHFFSSVPFFFFFFCLFGTVFQPTSQKKSSSQYLLCSLATRSLSMVFPCCCDVPVPARISVSTSAWETESSALSWKLIRSPPGNKYA